MSVSYYTTKLFARVIIRAVKKWPTQRCANVNTNGVFDFQNEIDMDLTHVTASVVGGQQYSRPEHTDIHLFQ